MAKFKRYTPKPITARLTDFKAYEAQLHANYDRLAECDKIAQENDTLKGRMFFFPCADSGAWYQVVGVRKTTVQVMKCEGINGDEWEPLRDGGWYDRQDIEGRVEWEARKKKLFAHS